MFRKLKSKIFLAITIFGTILNSINFDIYAMLSDELCHSQIENLITEETAKQILQNQIETFIKIAPNIFEVEENLIKEANPFILVQSITKLNKLFDKYKFFIDGLIKYHTKNGTKFKLGAFKEDSYSNAYSTIDEIRLNLKYYSLPIDTYKNKLLKEKKKGQSCDCDDEEIISYDISHEIGHIIRYAGIIIAQEKADDNYNFLFNNDIVKDIIFGICASKYGDFRREITLYARTNSNEWFAEVFAHLECSKNPKGVGLAMKDFLKEQENILSA